MKFHENLVTLLLIFKNQVLALNFFEVWRKNKCYFGKVGDYSANLGSFKKFIELKI